MILKWLFKKENFIESLFVVVCFSLAEKAVGIVRGIVFARFLGPENYGVFTMAFFFITLIISFSMLGIPSCYGRYVPQYEKKKMLRDFFWKTHSFAILTCGILFIPCVLFAEHLSRLIYKSSDYKNIIILSSIVILPLALYSNFYSSFTGLRNFKMSSLMQFVQIFIFSVMGAVLVIVLTTVESAMIAYLTSVITVTIIFGYLFWKYAFSHKDQSIKIDEDNFYGKILKFSIWFVLTPVVFELLRYTDRLMLNYFMGLKEVGVYSVATNVTQIVFMFGMMTANVLLPNVGKAWENQEKIKTMMILNLSTKMVIFLLLGCSVVIVLFKKQIILVLYGNNYIETLPIISMLLVFWLFNCIVWIIGMYPGLIEKTHLQMYAALPGLVLNIVLNYILIPAYGLIGAAIATSVSYGMILIILLLLLIKHKLIIDIRTVFICVSTLILLFDEIFMLTGFIILAFLFVLSDVIINKEEKQLLTQQIRKVFG